MSALQRLRFFRPPCALAACVCLTFAFQPNPAGEADAAFYEPGPEYRLIKQHKPVTNRIHTLRVALASGAVHPTVIVAPDPDGKGPAEAALTSPLQLAREPGLVAFVNANPWDSLPDAAGRRNRRWHAGQPVDIQGLAVSAGRMRSPPQPGYPAVWADAAGRWHFEDPPPDARPVEGLAGFQIILRQGAVAVPAGGPRHPRTAIGADRSGQTLWLVVVDGRQPGFSEGMTLEELARQMAELGCWRATNLDGGGSSVMAQADSEGRWRVVNSPSDRSLGLIQSVRPVPVLLAIRRSPAGGAAPADGR